MTAAPSNPSFLPIITAAPTTIDQAIQLMEQLDTALPAKPFVSIRA